MMEIKSFDVLRNGTKVVCKFDHECVYEIRRWRGETYLAGERNMWPASEFDPADFEIL